MKKCNTCCEYKKKDEKKKYIEVKRFNFFYGLFLSIFAFFICFITGLILIIVSVIPFLNIWIDAKYISRDIDDERSDLNIIFSKEKIYIKTEGDGE